MNTQRVRTAETQEIIMQNLHGQARTLRSCAEWNISNINSHLNWDGGVTAQTLTAIMSEATQALKYMAEAEKLEEILKYL